MESDADLPSSSHSGSQATTPPLSQPGATQKTRRTIHDFFAPLSSTTRQSSVTEARCLPAEFSASSQSNDASDDPPKKFKITANNGHTIMIRQPGRKKVKKEEDALHGSRQDENIGPVLPRRHHSRGKLGMLPSFPLDVVFEIFSHLLPIDLLHLARATKDIRAILLHRSASYVWKSALANVPELPECPNDVSLPRWASLAFDTFCQNCLSPNVRSVNFNLRVRYCNKCVKIKLLPDFSFDTKKNPKDKLIFQGVPFSRWNDRVEMYCTVVDKNKFLEEYHAHKGDTASFMKERNAALKLRAEHAIKCKKWFNNLLDRRSAELDEIREKRAELITEKLTAAGFVAELDFLALFADGVCAIRPWPLIIEFEEHPHVKVPKPLTEKAWERMKDDMFKYMRDISVQVEKDTRARLEQKRRVAFHTAYVNWRCLPQNLAKYPSHKLMPGPADILDDSQIIKLIEMPRKFEYGASDAMEFLEESFTLDDFIVSWREEKILHLFNEADYMGFCRRRFSNEWPSRSLSDDYGPRASYELKEDILKSAVFVFRCDNRSSHWVYDMARLDEGGDDHREAECLWYPDFFFHPCTSMDHFSWEERRTKHDRNLTLEKQFRGMRRDPWDANRLKFDEKASRTVRKLLEAAALDLKTTVEKMDELDHRFVCLKCTFGTRCDGSRKVRVWSWRDAVQHCLRTHFGDSRVTWECLYPEDREKALALQAVEHTKRGYPAPDARKMWKCMRCRDTSSESPRMNMAELTAHFVQKPKHGNVDQIDDGEGVLYYKARDYSPKELAPVRMIPEAHEPMRPPLTWLEEIIMKDMSFIHSKLKESS